MSQSTKTQDLEAVHQKIICNNPYAEPTCHFPLESFGAGEPNEGRRPAGYMLVTSTKKSKSGQVDSNKASEDEIENIPLDLVNEIRKRVKGWREAGYPGATRITRELFFDWFGPDREEGIAKPYFAQQEAVETIVYLHEAPKSEWGDLTWPEEEITGGKGLDTPSDGKLLRRAIKMATGTGKTLVMGMLIVWQALNKAANSKSDKYSKNILVVVPNLTVKRRLEGSDGINPKEDDAVYWQKSGWGLVPKQYLDSFGNTKVVIHNWQKLTAKSKRGNYESKVVDLGEESDKVFASRLLKGLGSGKIFILNDEGHHAWRVPDAIAKKRAALKASKLKKAEQKEVDDARIWVQALDKIQKERGATTYIDMSATPMWPSSASGDLAWRLFPWVVSDFPLADAIESGLTKIPCRPVYDDSGQNQPAYYDLWERVRDYLPRRNKNVDPAAWINQIDAPLKQLAGKWAETLENWEEAGRSIPPVLIAVCDNTKMSETLSEHIGVKGEAHPKLKNTDSEPLRTVRYDSAAKKERDAEDKGQFSKVAEIVNTVGKEGLAGEQVRCVVSVAMLTEGWDAKNVTQILGLRPFLSPLLCEQVLGRGLRRTGPDRANPEIVEVYGVPVMLLPQVELSAGKNGGVINITPIKALKSREHLAIEFPRVKFLLPDALEYPKFNLDLVQPIIMTKADPDATFVGTGVGAPTTLSNREEAYRVYSGDRYIRYLAVEIANAWEDMRRKNNTGSPDYEEGGEFYREDGYYRSNVFPSCIQAVADVLKTKVKKEDPSIPDKEIINYKYRSMILDRVLNALVTDDKREPAWWPVMEKPSDRGGTYGYLRNTSRKKELVPAIKKSHLSHAVCDSKLEMSFVRVLESHEQVVTWVKNDQRLGLLIRYRHQGLEHFYVPDFIIRTKSEITLIIEAKGRADNKDAAKRTEVVKWCSAVTRWGEMGHWETGEFSDTAALTDFLDSYAPKSLKLSAVGG